MKPGPTFLPLQRHHLPCVSTLILKQPETTAQVDLSDLDGTCGPFFWFNHRSFTTSDIWKGLRVKSLLFSIKQSPVKMIFRESALAANTTTKSQEMYRRTYTTEILISTN